MLWVIFSFDFIMKMEVNEHNKLLVITLSNTEWISHETYDEKVDFLEYVTGKDHLLHASMQVQCTVTRFLTNTICFYDEKHIIVKSNSATKYRIAVK